MNFNNNNNSNFAFPNVGNVHDMNAFLNNMMAENYRRDQQRARAAEEARRNAEEEERQHKKLSFIMKFLFVTTILVAFFTIKLTMPSHHKPIAVSAPTPPPVPEPPKIVLKPTFIFSAPRLEQIKTHSPADYNSVKAQALFDLFGPVDEEEEANKEKDCCNEADILCRVRAVMPKYIDAYVPSFAIPYLFPAEPPVDDEPEEKPLNMTKIAFEILEYSFVTETTPAYLPSGPLTKETAMSFFQLMHGDFRNAKQDDDEEEMAREIEESIERCPESDSFSSIFSSIVELFKVQQLAKAPNTWFTGKPGSGRAFNTHRFVNVAFSRFREMPEVRYQYHLQGTLQYELLKNHVDFKSECENLWEEFPAVEPTSFTDRVWTFYNNWKAQRKGEQPEIAPRMPMLKERACFDASFARMGVCPLRVATCHAFARDSAPVDYEEHPPTPYLGAGWLHYINRKGLAPLIPDDCHIREHLMYDYLRNQFDYADVCTEFWTQHPHTSPSANREKKVVVDGKKTTLWKREFTKNPKPMESFCLSFELERNPGVVLGLLSDPPADVGERPKDVPEILQLLHSN